MERKSYAGLLWLVIVAVLMCYWLAGCGGGSEPLGNQGHDATTQPVPCHVGAASGVCS